MPAMPAMLFANHANPANFQAMLFANHASHAILLLKRIRIILDTAA